MGLARTYQQSRLFAGLTVEDNIYLSILGIDGGHLRPLMLPKKDPEYREQARRAAGRPRSTTSSPCSSARCRTASTGRSHSRSRSPRSRGC